MRLQLHRMVAAGIDACRLGPLRRLIRRRRAVALTTGPGAGLRFCQGRSMENHGSGANELPVQQALERVLARGGVLYDVGANVGFLTIIGARLVGTEGAVYAFEPVPSNTTTLRRNLRLNGFRHVEVLEEAVSSEPGFANLILAADAGGSALETADRPPDATGQLRVATTALDTFVARPGVRPPTVVKIDVEGGELDVLRGMTGTLRVHRPAVIFEIDGPDEPQIEPKALACIAFVEANDYLVRRLPDSYPNNRWQVRHYLAMPWEYSRAGQAGSTDRVDRSPGEWRGP